MSAIARANALPLEVKKDGLSQRQDGSWIIRFRIHPDDMRSELAQAAMGSRWMMVLVEIDDDETPKEKNQAAERLVQRAGILCTNENFQTFLRTEWPMDWERIEKSENNSGGGDNENTATILLRILCEVRSRRELATNSKASAAFENLLGRFEGWKRNIE